MQLRVIAKLALLAARADDDILTHLPATLATFAATSQEAPADIWKSEIALRVHSSHSRWQGDSLKASVPFLIGDGALGADFGRGSHDGSWQKGSEIAGKASITLDRAQESATVAAGTRTLLCLSCTRYRPRGSSFREGVGLRGSQTRFNSVPASTAVLNTADSFMELFNRPFPVHSG
ncbi:hypothetical protein VTO73DRAFT_13488 [Trametes versicolor]